MNTLTSSVEVEWHEGIRVFIEAILGVQWAADNGLPQLNTKVLEDDAAKIVSGTHS